MIIRIKYFSNMAKKFNMSEIFNFDNKALRILPIDSVKGNSTRQVKDACFSLIDLDHLKNPQMVAYSSSAFGLLDVDSNVLKNEKQELSEFLCGNRIFNGSQPAAHCYCGHQFGKFAGQLGDGAVMYLGEIVNKNNERWEIQLKGSGKTPYSRFADGRKVLRSSLREFLCSEAMHFLGIPTSRAGSIVTSDTLVERDIFYDGHPIMEKASVVLRIAPTFIRFGSFEICKPSDLETGRTGPSAGNMDILKTLLQYVVQTYYPEIWKHRGEDDLKSCYLEFFTELVKRTAILIAKWQSVGFCHGVLNTDNMSIVGITIDYGPFGFMDRYDPNFICNASDTGGRYSFTNQPSVCKWNCTKLAEALKDIIPLDESKEIIDKTYDESYRSEYFHRMFLKIGMTYSNEFEYLITDLLQTMYETGTDYTNTFLALERIIENISNNQETSLDFLLTQTATLDELKNAFKPTLSREDRAFFWRMANNERDRLISMGGQFILDDEEKQEKLEKFEKLSEQDQQNENISLWKKWIETYKSTLQQYWKTHNIDVKDSLIKMRNNNPRIVLRNYLADIAIKAAEKSDFSKAKMLLERLERPFSEGEVFTSIPIDFKGANSIMYERPPMWANDLKVT